MGRHRPCTAISSVSTPTSDAKRLANGAPLGQGEAPSGAAGNCHRRGEGRLAQLVERLVYTEDVGSSSLSSPTIPDQPVVTATQMFTLRSALVRQDAPLPFIVREERRQALLNGWDDTAMILHQWGEAIDRFEARQQRVQPWLYHR